MLVRREGEGLAVGAEETGYLEPMVSEWPASMLRYCISRFRRTRARSYEVVRGCPISEMGLFVETR